jgi:LacI family transcriptional regulator
MPAPHASLRSIARTLGLSHTTVSDALRGTGRVDPATVARVQKAAREAGYQRNPLTATLMSQLRRSRGGTFRGLLAVLSRHEPEQPAPGSKFRHELVLGASTRASELGFMAEEFIVGQAGLTEARLELILRTRDIHGIVVLPEWGVPDWSKFAWPNYAGIYADYGIERPALHCVCCDHYRSMMAALTRLHALGYKRPGLYLQEQQDRRLLYRFSAAFSGFKLPSPRVPPLIAPKLQRDEFATWFRKFQPDVVLAHYTYVLDWMEECGAKVPATHGFLCLNDLYKTRPAAGLDQQPREIGARCAELVIAQLQRNDRGVPGWPTTTTIPARWIDGPTLRLHS